MPIIDTHEVAQDPRFSSRGRVLTRHAKCSTCGWESEPKKQSHANAVIALYKHTQEAHAPSQCPDCTSDLHAGPRRDDEGMARDVLRGLLDAMEAPRTHKATVAWERARAFLAATE